MRKLILKIKKHKISTIIIILVLIGGGYYDYGKFSGGKATISYITAAVQKETLIASISGSGQISASNQVDIKAKVSGEVAKIAVVNGQQVKTGGLIAQLDTKDAYKTVRDARSGLESAQLSLDKLKQAAAVEVIFQAENALTAAQTNLDKLKLSQPTSYQDAKDALRNAQDALVKTYLDAFNNISNVFVNLPNIITLLDDILYSERISLSDTSVGKGQFNISALYNSTHETDQFKIKTYQTIAEEDYKAARVAYDADFVNFKNVNIYSEPTAMENLLAETLSAIKATAQAIKSENNYLSSWADARALRNWPVFLQVTTYQASLSSYASQVNTYLSNLLNLQSTVQDDKDNLAAANNNLVALKQNQPLDLTAAENSLKEKKIALASLIAGTDPLDIRTQQLSLEQKRNVLSDAQVALADYTIRAPFDGVIAAVNLKVGDSASGAAIATLITAQKIAEISLNEVDVAKIKTGDKVTLTFDAIEGLTISGQVAEISSIGTVSQGVVTYNVKISFDTQDSRVKPGMSASATIITDIKTDVLVAPNAAVKSGLSGGSYVQILDANGRPQDRTVQVGLANDVSTEITGGLSEGEKVVTQTINSAAANGGATQRSSGSFGGLRIPGVGGR